MRALTAILFAASCFAQTPTPESVLGYKPGADFKLATYDDALSLLPQARGGIEPHQACERREDLAGTRLVRGVHFGRREPGAVGEAQGDVAAARGSRAGWTRNRRGPWRARSSRSSTSTAACTRPRSAGAQHTIQFGYDLAASEEPEFKAIRANLIVELWFSINPDGQNIVAEWYRSNVGTPYEVSPLPVLYQEYVGHDNNRDGYMLNMAESRVVTKATLDTQPLIFYTQHQSAPFPGRIYLPPYADPISANMHPLMQRWLNLIGTSIATYLDDHALPGSMHQETFDVWYPGYIDNIGNFRHSISFFTETALYRYATPHFYTVDEFPSSRQTLGTEMLYSSPWKGGWWRLADACAYMYGADMAVLNLAVKYREQLQYNKYRAARDTIEKFTKEPPFAYQIPRVQRDAPTAALLLERLMLNGIEVHQSADPDAWIVLMDQPFAGMVKELFEPQSYPNLAQRPYDVTGWTLPYQMGIEAHALTTPLTKSVPRLAPVREGDRRPRGSVHLVGERELSGDQRDPGGEGGGVGGRGERVGDLDRSGQAGRAS